MNEVSKIQARPPLEDGIRPDFVPANRNTDSRVFELEKERLWSRIWHIAAREESQWLSLSPAPNGGGDRDAIR